MDELLYIKIQESGKKRWSFLSGNSAMTHLRIHAVRFYDKEKAQSLADEIMELNEGIKAKVVKA